MWFAGAHADIGGGYKTRSLADIPLVCMAKQAEAARLSLDWRCLPNPTALDAAAPPHESSSGLFALDRYHPTLREIGMKKCPVKLNGSHYEALDEAAKPISTIKITRVFIKVCLHGTQPPRKCAPTISMAPAV